MRRLALGLLFAMAGCGRSGAPAGGTLEERIPYPRSPAPGDPVETQVWHSWNVEIADDELATVTDTNGGVVANMTFYVGGNSFSVQPGTVLDAWASVHPNAPQDAGPVRFEDGADFPYVGKNLSPRMPSDPAPLGVFDLQLHPRDDDRWVVAAFETPLSGSYVVSGFSAHRVLAGGADATASLLLGGAPQSVESTVTTANDMQWDFAAADTDLGTLSAGEHICFALHRGTDSAVDDATEIAFTITRTAD